MNSNPTDGSTSNSKIEVFILGNFVPNPKMINKMCVKYSVLKSETKLKPGPKKFPFLYQHCISLNKKPDFFHR